MNEQFHDYQAEPLKEVSLYRQVKEIFNFDFVTGLPCGELKSFISESRGDSEAIHLQASNEREAVGISAGAYLAGKKPVLYMQNSGFFEASNDVGSLLIASKIPALFVVSWRGVPGETATQHFATGAATTPLIESLGLPYSIWPDGLSGLKEKVNATGLPGVLLVKKEVVNTGPIDNVNESTNTTPSGEMFRESPGEVEMSREESIEKLFSRLVSPKDAVISSTGLISRSVFHFHDSPNQFYNAGGFGLTALIGLGFELNKKDVRTIVLDGDGSVLTNLGSLNIIGHSGVRDFVHVILDNGAYFSCSGEKTVGAEKIPEIARILGYQKVYSVSTASGLEAAIERLNESDGLQMLHINIKCEGTRDLKRPLNMEGNALRFKNYFSE